MIIEGIHGLNPILVAKIFLRILNLRFVSCLSRPFLSNDHNWIPTTDTRILRRVIRDYKYRGYSATETLLHDGQV